MRHWRIWVAVIGVLVLAGSGGWALWNYDLRWRPRTIERHQAKIAHTLQTAGWVSAGLKGPKLYMVSYRSCPACLRFKAEEVPRLLMDNIDVRIIEVARPDLNGLSRSTPAERATVAELWLNRDWALLEQWGQVRPESWTATGLPPADGDRARTAVVEAGRSTVEELTALLKASGVDFAYPMLIWWDAKGRMRGCACERRQSQRWVRRDLGVS